MVISELFLYFIGLTPKKHLLSSLKDMQAPLRQLVWLFLMFLPIYVAFFSLWTFCTENCRMAKLQKYPYREVQPGFDIIAECCRIFVVQLCMVFQFPFVARCCKVNARAITTTLFYTLQHSAIPCSTSATVWNCVNLFSIVREPVILFNSFISQTFVVRIS